MTGDAVNDAAALKQADIGVAMGSGSEVTKQAGKMILTDDNFGTLVTAVRLGRSTYEKIVNYVRYQMSQLLSLVLLFLTASIFNINDGIALTPLMVLFLNFFIAIFPVIVIVQEPALPGLMTKPPRDPNLKLANPVAVRQWAFYGAVLFLVTLAALLRGPGELAGDQASVPMTMGFVVMAFGTILSGLVLRRSPEPGLAEPVLGALKTLSIPVLITIVAVEWTFMQNLLLTTSLTGGQWAACIGLALLVPITIELSKIPQRRHLPTPPLVDPAHAVNPARAIPHTGTPVREPAGVAPATT
jgi:P-type Ca2+ transporter type 2C